MSDQTPPEQEIEEAPAAKPRATFKPLLLVSCAIAVLIVVQNVRRSMDDDSPVSGSSSERTVRLVIEGIDEKPREIEGIPWHDDMTVLEALAQAKIPFSQKGEDELAMLTAIDGLENEGGGLEAKNWMYWVNGAMAKDSFAIHRLKPADTILWKFGTSQYNEQTLP